MLDWLEKEVATQQQKVEDSERELANYRDRENAMSLDDKNNIVLSRLNALNDAVLRARTKRIEKEAQFNQVRSMTPGATAESIPVVSQNPQIQSGKLQLTELQRQKAQLSEKYGEKHPEILRSTRSWPTPSASSTSRRPARCSRSRTNTSARVLEERTLSAGLEEAKTDAQDLSRKSVSYNVMEREAHSNRTVYESLLQRANELRVSSNSRANNVRVIDRAEVPKGPMTPTGRRTWLLSLAVGLVAAVGRRLRPRLHERHDQDAGGRHPHLKLTFLGLVPSVPGRQAPDARLVARAARFRRSRSGRLRTSLISQYPGEGAKIDPRHERAAARRQDHDGLQHRDGAGLRRCPRAADRRRHAPARACTARCG